MTTQSDVKPNGAGQDTTQTGPDTKTSILGDQTTKPGDETKVQEITELKLKFPEGIEAEAQKPYIEFSKKHGFKSETAQEVVDLIFKERSGAEESMNAEVAKAREKILTDWLDESKKDGEIGGVKFVESVTLATKAAEKFGGHEFVELLAKSGYGRNKTMIKFLSNVGKAISEDSIRDTGGGDVTTVVDPEAAMKAAFPASPEMFKK